MKGGKHYETVAADPVRDEETAIKKTEKAQRAFENGNLARAEELLQEALIADVQYGPAHNNLGLVYFSQQRFYLAAWEFEYALQSLANRPEPHNNLGMVYEEVDRLDEAVANYAMAVQLAPNNAQFLGNLARATLKQNQHDPAAAELLRQLLMHDTRPDWVQWARERLATGKFDPPTARAETSNQTETLPAPQPTLPSPERALRDELPLPEPLFPTPPTATPPMAPDAAPGASNGR